MSKQIGLLTVHRVNNCGSYLQTYATVAAVEKLGYSCTVIDYKYPSLWHLKHAAGDEHKSTGSKSVLKRLLGKVGLLEILRNIKIWNYYRIGAKGLRRFADVKMTRPYSRAEILRNPPRFDVYLTGSDQVWNPRYMADDYTYLLDFTPNDTTRVAYASSFGCKQLPNEFVADYSRLLARYRSVSVRESSGLQLVSSLTGQQAVDVVDPTFLLSRDEWCKMAGNKLAGRGGFIFCYIMTYVFDPFPSLIDYLKCLADNLHKDVVVYCPKPILSLQGDPRFCFIIGSNHMLEPQEFLEYYMQADYIVSTSFHGVAFAVNFKKNFLAILNPKESSDDRVASFLQKVGLLERGLRSGDPLDSRYFAQIDYREANGRIEGLIKASKEYLRCALSDDG